MENFFRFKTSFALIQRRCENNPFAHRPAKMICSMHARPVVGGVTLQINTKNCVKNFLSMVSVIKEEDSGTGGFETVKIVNTNKD